MDFNSRIDEAIRINIYGTMKMFDLAKQAKHFESFLHVSTAYVNSDKLGLIEEKVYDIGIDPEEYIESLMKMSKEEV